MRKIGVFAFLCILCFLVLGWQKPKEGGAFKIGIPGDVGSFIPWRYFSYGVRAKVLANIYENLIATDWDKSRAKPGLAVDWEVDEENKVFTLRLREGTRFHDGKPVTVDDVVASASQFPQDIQFKVEKVDRMRVRFDLTEPASTFLLCLSRLEYFIATSSSVNECTVLRRKGEDARFRPVGSGPFVFESWKEGKEVVLVANKDYWGGRPYLSRLVYRVIPSHEEMIAAVEKGEVDLIDLIYPEDLVRLKKNKNLSVKSTYGLTLCYLGMNNKKPPFSDHRVRRAIGLSLDKFTLAKKFVYGGYGVPTDRPLSPAFFGFPTFPKVGEYNPKEAKRLLAQAGYRQGFSAKLVTLPFSRPYLPDPRGCAEEIKRELALVGIEVELIFPEDMKGYIDMVLNDDDYDLALAGWTSPAADPDFMLTPVLGSSSFRGEVEINLARFSNDLFNESLLAARRLPLSDVWGRVKLYNEAIGIFNEQLPFIPLFHTRLFLVCNKRVKGVKPTPSGLVSFTRVWLKD